MKFYLFSILTLSIFTVSCATGPKSKPEVVQEAAKLPVKSYAEKKDKIKSILNNHAEIKLEKRKKVEAILVSALDKSEELRGKESQIILKTINLTLVENAKYEELMALKKELKKIYQRKYENFETTVDSLKKILGISPNYKFLMDEIGTVDLFFRN